MADNIHRLPGAETGPLRQGADPCPYVIAMLDDLMARAKAGQIESVAWVALTPQGSSTMAWIVASGADHAIMGALAVAQGAMVRDFVNRPDFEEFDPHGHD